MVDIGNNRMNLNISDESEISIDNHLSNDDNNSLEELLDNIKQSFNQNIDYTFISLDNTYDYKVDEKSFTISSINTINKRLRDNGFSIDSTIANTSDISIDKINEWTKSLEAIIIELLDRDTSYKETTNYSIYLQKNESLNHDHIEQLKEDYEKKIITLNKQINLQTNKITDLEDIISEYKRKMKSDEVLLRKASKQHELQFQECERRVRQKEIEMNKLKEKLSSFIDKQRESESKLQNILNSYRKGNDQSNESKQSTNSPNSKSNSFVSKKNKTSNLSPSKQVDDIIKALELENVQLINELKDINNENKELLLLLSNNKSINNNKEDIVNKSTISEHIDIINNQQLLYNKIKDLTSIINHLEMKLTHLTNDNNQLSDNNSKQDLIIKDLQIVNDNLSYEISTLPKISDYKHLSNQLIEKENIINNLKNIINNKNQIKKYLTNYERIQIDKKNYQLNLLSIEFIDKNILVDIIQEICRLLDLSNIYEITMSINKLLTSIKIIPKLEKYLISICHLLSKVETKILNEKEINNATDVIVNMEDIVPILKKWSVFVLSHDQ